MKTARALTAVVLLLGPALLACSDSSGPGNNGGGGGGSSALTVSNAAPASGNGAVASLTTVVDTVPLTLGDAQHFLVTGTVGGTPVKVEIYVLLSDNSVPLVEHTWGADLNAPDGFTVCSATGNFSACAANQITGTVSQAKVVMNGLVLGAATGDSDASTLTGTLDY